MRKGEIMMKKLATFIVFACGTALFQLNANPPVKTYVLEDFVTDSAHNIPVIDIFSNDLDANQSFLATCET